ncbi:MAG TPA: S1/P1 nuclease [Chthoniobacterales bacterium]|nr:S1/P1 nuclease [Chthoniobacterales bacterium]
MRPPGLIAAICLFAAPASVLAYGPVGHQIVGGIADKLIANTAAEKKIYALSDGITLQRAAVIADEIRAWDKNGVDDPNAFPHYADHPQIDQQLRDFWRANPPTEDPTSPVPSHHWFHYTDVPVLNPHTYSDGNTGRSQWDVVHMISYCVAVLRGEVPENNPRKITKPIAVILLAHYVGDIHQPLHVGADYFNEAGRAVDPDKQQAGIEDEGGNTVSLYLFQTTSSEIRHRGLKLHGFWDNEAVLMNLPERSLGLSKEENYQETKHAIHTLIDQLVKQEPQNWRPPVGVALKNSPELWANEILPLAREAHERVKFSRMHQTIDQGRLVMAGVAHERLMPDQIPYSAWSANIVRGELHKAGWRLANLLRQVVESTSSP